MSHVSWGRLPPARGGISLEVLYLLSSMIRRRPWLVALLVGVVAAGAAGLVSAHGGDTTLIHACVHPSTKSVIVYSAPGLAGSEPATSQCGTRGTPLDWSAAGSAGAPGPTGPSGG